MTLNGGSVNLTNPNSLLNAGNYTLIDYGTISGSVASLGTPTGPAGFNYQLIDTGSVIRLVVSEPPVGMPGDYNDDGTVDTADYIVWAKNRNTTNTLPNDNDLGGTIGEAHYALWLNHFGQTEAGSGGQNGPVPEPSAAALAVLGLIGFAAGRCRR